MCPPPNLKTKYYKYNRRPPMSFSCITSTAPLPQGEWLLWIEMAHFHILLSTLLICFSAQGFSYSSATCFLHPCWDVLCQVTIFIAIRYSISGETFILFLAYPLSRATLCKVSHVSQGTCVRAPLGEWLTHRIRTPLFHWILPDSFLTWL